MLNLFPTKQQWKSWSLPSKLTAIGALVSVISLGLYGIEKSFHLKGLMFEQVSAPASTALSMNDAEQREVADAAWKTMLNVLDGQPSGTTLRKWKRETYEELTKNLEGLPDDVKISRILTRLRQMVEKDKEWERNNPRDEQTASERHLAEPGEKERTASSMASSAIASAMFHGVMEDNRTFHRIRKELLEDVSALASDRKPAQDIIDHLNNVLCN